MTARPDSPERSEGAVHPVGALALHVMQEAARMGFLVPNEPDGQRATREGLGDLRALQSALAAMTAERDALTGQLADAKADADWLANALENMHLSYTDNATLEADEALRAHRERGK